MIRIIIQLTTGESYTEDFQTNREVVARIKEIKRYGYAREESLQNGAWWPVSQIQSIQWREHDEVLQSQKEALQGIARFNAENRTHQIAVPLPTVERPQPRLFVVQSVGTNLDGLLQNPNLDVTEVAPEVVRDLVADGDPNEKLTQVGTRWLGETSEDREKKIDQPIACEHRWERDPKADTTICRNCGANLEEKPPLNPPRRHGG